MDLVVDEVVDPRDLEKFRKEYEEQCLRGKPDYSAAFNYAWALIRASTKSQQKSGIEILETLFRQSSDEVAKRDYLFYMAVGSTRLQDYEKALRYVDGFLKVEPQNPQAKQLKKLIDKRIKKDGLFGMAMTGGAFAVGGLVAAGIAASIAFAIKK